MSDSYFDDAVKASKAFLKEHIAKLGVPEASAKELDERPLPEKATLAGARKKYGPGLYQANIGE